LRYGRALDIQEETMAGYTVTTEGTTEVTVDELGDGHPILLLHGGAGPMSVAGFGRLLSDQRDARVLVPTHPGFNGTVRPSWLTTPRQLAAVYVALLDELGLEPVTVVGSSIGGWVAAEIALLASPRVSSVVIVDAVGIVVDEHPPADFFALSFDELARLSYHEPDKFRLDPATMSEQQLATMAGNRQAIEVYGGRTMTDPTLRGRLAEVAVPTLVVWGEADGIATPAYGQVLAAAIPTASFVLIGGAGHLPQLEQPGQMLDTVWEFAQQHLVRAADRVS
jgi:pimeloyl-ACP methyl ester carboxylesterase